MVNVALALLATLAALGGAGLLVTRTLPDRRMYLLAWCGTLLVLGIALASMTVGYAAGFEPALLRCTELFGSLIAPLTLALGVVELIARTVQARFAARLIAASYVIVAVVIILLDPIVGTFGKSLPKVSGHYSSLPGLVLDGAHLFAVVSLVSCVAVTAVRGNRRDRQAAETMPTLAMVALAGVLTVAAMRGYLPGPLAPLALGGSAALVWFGASRLAPGGPPAPDDEEPEPYEEMSRHQQPYDDGQYNNGRRRGRRRQQGGYDTGGYDAEGYDTGGYDTGGYDTGGYDTGGYDTGGYDRGGYDTGGYDTGGYARPRREGQPSFAPCGGGAGPCAPGPARHGPVRPDHDLYDHRRARRRLRPARGRGRPRRTPGRAGHPRLRLPHRGQLAEPATVLPALPRRERGRDAHPPATRPAVRPRGAGACQRHQRPRTDRQRGQPRRSRRSDGAHAAPPDPAGGLAGLADRRRPADPAGRRCPADAAARVDAEVRAGAEARVDAAARVDRAGRAEPVGRARPVAVAGPADEAVPVGAAGAAVPVGGTAAVGDRAAPRGPYAGPMADDARILLLGKPGCHLCDDAREVIVKVMRRTRRDLGRTRHHRVGGGHASLRGPDPGDVRRRRPARLLAGRRASPARGPHGLTTRRPCWPDAVCRCAVPVRWESAPLAADVSETRRFPGPRSTPEAGPRSGVHGSRCLFGHTATRGGRDSEGAGVRRETPVSWAIRAGPDLSGARVFGSRLCARVHKGLIWWESRRFVRRVAQGTIRTGRVSNPGKAGL